MDSQTKEKRQPRDEQTPKKSIPPRLERLRGFVLLFGKLHEDRYRSSRRDRYFLLGGKDHA